MSKTRTVKTEYLARVEGEGGMLVKMRDGRVIRHYYHRLAYDYRRIPRP